MAAIQKHWVCNKLVGAILRHRFVRDGGFLRQPPKAKRYLEEICSIMAAKNPRQRVGNSRLRQRLDKGRFDPQPNDLATALISIYAGF